MITRDLVHCCDLPAWRMFWMDVLDWPVARQSTRDRLAACDRHDRDAGLVELRRRFNWEYEGMPGG